MNPDNAERIADLLMKIKVVEEMKRESDGDVLSVLNKAHKILVEMFMDYTREFS